MPWCKGALFGTGRVRRIQVIPTEPQELAHKAQLQVDTRMMSTMPATAFWPAEGRRSCTLGDCPHRTRPTNMQHAPSNTSKQQQQLHRRRGRASKDARQMQRRFKLRKGTRLCGWAIRRENLFNSLGCNTLPVLAHTFNAHTDKPQEALCHHMGVQHRVPSQYTCTPAR